MQLSKESLAEFVRIWKDEFGEELSLDEARIRAERLLEFYLLLAQVSSDYQP